MNFAEACEMAQAGRFVRRNGWSKRHFIYHVRTGPGQMELRTQDGLPWKTEGSSAEDWGTFEGTLSDAQHYRIDDEWFLELDPKFRDGAISVLRVSVAKSIFEEVRQSYAEHGRSWIHAENAHFGWGMMVRNLLRHHGYLDKLVKTGNLDDYYVQIVEAAAGVRTIPGPKASPKGL
jgi:hypothetical protein